ncbi:MAG: hypothetical protein CVT92_00625 [Bacteroidetes bacterium HGW-Bacteroidetes-1]|jgi:hypothetical protein|nr:MAG: hypothetical protein CVT92_00625 [Bacteroidetes bacterium HGW-Bacteroidetes-1]
MRIAGYIGELIYEYECVVIPGLGGFLTRDHNAFIHPVKHYFKPPHREIVFNPLLRTNDGLLLNYIARSEQLSYQEAKSRLDRFVFKCVSVLDEGKKINFRNIGYIYLNADKKIVFEADENQNYQPDSFGLSGFISPPVIREEFHQKVEKVFLKPPQKQEEIPQKEHKTPETKPKQSAPKRMVASRRSNGIKRQLLVVGAAASIIFGAWGNMNKHIVQQYYYQYSGYASLLPFFYSSPNEYLIHNMDKIPVEKLILEKKVPDNIVTSSILKSGSNDLVQAAPYQVPEDEIQSPAKDLWESIEPLMNDEASNNGELTKNEINENLSVSDNIEEITTLEEVVVEPIKVEIATKNYYIIGGAFKEKNNAERLIQKLREKNFQADYVGQTSGGLWRVYFSRFESETQALQQLQVIKRSENENAWLLVI